MLRSRWPATAGLTLIVAVVSAVVLTFAAGARRTSSAPDRYTAAVGGAFDGLIFQDHGRPRTAEIAALPGALSAQSLTFVFGAFTTEGHADVDAIAFAGSYDANGRRLISGRAPADTAEFVASRSFVENNHAFFGDTFNLVTLTQEQADATGFDTPDPGGPRLRATLVGIVDGPSALDDPSAIAIFPLSLLDDPHIGVSATLTSVGLAPGVDLDAFRTQLDSLPESSVFSLQPAEVVSSSVRKAVKAQALGLWALAGVAALAAVAAIGQLITRHVRLSPDERERLAAIGFDDAQLLSESMGRAAVPILTGTLLGIGGATLASGIFPMGFVRRVEPDVGLRFETTVLILGVVALLGALMLWTLAALLLARWASRRARRPSAVIEAIASRSGASTASTGLRFAFTRRERDGGSMRTVVIGLLLTVGALVGAVTFAASLDRLVSEPARFGNNYDLQFGNGSESVSTELRKGLDGDADVAGLMLYAPGQARVGPATLRLVGMELVRGDIAPKVLSGRLPAGKDEIGLGRLAAHALGVGVGDDVSLDGETVTRKFHVTGLVVVPGIGLNDGIGQDAILTMAGLAQLDPAATANTAVVTLRHGAAADTADRLSTLTGVAASRPSYPSAIINVARIRSIPFVLAAFLGALALLTVVHVMLTSVQSRRKDVAILRSIGADGGWIARAVYWQATTFTLLPVAIGIPLGLIVGRTVFASFADSIGALNDPSIPVLLLTLVGCGLVVLAAAVAAVPAHRANRLAPARLLQTE